MGLTDILCLINLLGLIAVAVLLVLNLRRPQAQGGSIDRETMESIEAMIEKAGRDTEEQLKGELSRSQSALRSDVTNEVRVVRTETVNTVRTSVAELGRSLTDSQRAAAEAQEKLIREMNGGLQDKITAQTESLQNQIKLMSDAQDKQMGTLLVNQKTEAEAQEKLIREMNGGLQDKITAQTESLQNQIKLMSDAQDKQMEALRTAQNNRMDVIAGQVKAFTEQSAAAQEALRTGVDKKLTDMQAQNTEQLEKMRETVDEKLQKTLNERISQSFQTVSEQLTAVYQGLGEMKTLAGSVGDLKKVLSGVKTRGILGEIQLGTIIEDMLNPDQYEKNVVTIPGSRNPVEYAVCLPGDGAGRIYLPIDSKFPGDTYLHLTEAYESGDAEAVREAQKALAVVLRSEAKDIHDKYVAPPYTTNFGVMFLPTEGLYAEAVRMGLAETLRQDYQITISGPTTLAALLNSLQMGFRTLAIQKRSGEVWQVLGAVKTEFGKFGDVLAAAQTRIEQTGKELDKLVGVRTRKINSKLKSVTELPVPESDLLIDSEAETDDAAQ